MKTRYTMIEFQSYFSAKYDFLRATYLAPFYTCVT